MFELGKTRVLKIAFTDVGVYQNETEARLYQEQPEHLASVYAIEKYVLVMEKLDAYNKYDALYKSPFNAKIRVVIEKVNKLIGKRLDHDNYQVGKSKNGQYKCYDYGLPSLYKFTDKMNERYFDTQKGEKIPEKMIKLIREKEL